MLELIITIFAFLFVFFLGCLLGSLTKDFLQCSPTWELESIHTDLDVILRTLRTISEKESIIMSDLSVLGAAVAESTSVSESAILLIGGLAARVQALADELAAGGTDATAIQALADQLNAESAALAAAVSANTPAAPVDPAPVEPPVEEPPADPAPVEEPPADPAPVEEPPVEPPVEEPPVEPPVEEPPVEPPVEEPPVDPAPVEEPPA